MQDILQKYENELKQVELRLNGYFQSEVSLIPEISSHLINSGGKRIRPLLLLIASDLCGYRGERRFPFSAIIEFIHTASLLHDDVIDRAETRRNKPSANHVWGNSASILVGDFLYSKSFKLMADDGDMGIVQYLSGITNQMAVGEIFQLVKCRDINMTEDEYFFLVEKKTAILMSAACAIGAMLAGARRDRVDALADFGRHIGMAFQLIDDTLDYIAEEEEFGKAIGMDLREGKMTLPLIKALRECTNGERGFIKGMFDKNVIDPGELRDMISLVKKYEGIDYACNKAVDLIRTGKTYLEVFQDSAPKECLLVLSDFILDRKI